MRNLLSAAIASIALATVFVGSASAATDQPTAGNLAMQDELQRDATQNVLHRAPLGELVTPADSTQASADRSEQGAYIDGPQAWLHRSPLGERVQQAAGAPSGISAHD